MYQTLQQQADYWSYMNEFYVIAWLCVVCFVGVLFFKKVPLARAAADVKASSL